MSRWPHAPSHEIDHPGAYILTAGTHYKRRLFHDETRLEMLEEVLLTTLEDLNWQVQAWAVFSNHYHFVGISPDNGLGLTELTKTIHRNSARELNRLDSKPGRAVWYHCWDTKIEYTKSYLARLAYVHNNPVKHGLVRQARDYRHCSAEWFFQNANEPFYKTVTSFPADTVNVYDDFDLDEAQI